MKDKYGYYDYWNTLTLSADYSLIRVDNQGTIQDGFLIDDDGTHEKVSIGRTLEEVVQEVRQIIEAKRQAELEYYQSKMQHQIQE